MSADDQRAAEERVLELCDMDYERAAATAAQFDRLRAELAETRAAGDALAFAVAPIERMGRGAPGSRLDVLITRAEAWRSVRGDAPTAGGLLPDNRILIDLTPPSRAIPADQRRKLAAELRSRFVDGPVDEWSAGWLSAAGYIGSDSPIGTDAGTDLAARGDAPAEPPAVELPVTLSSVDDVAAVCEQAGLDRNGDEWHADGVRVERVARQGWVYLVHRHWLMYGRQPIAELHPGAPSSLLLAAIEAARGETR